MGRSERTNPFTPAFGGKPQHFFGRNAELRMAQDALANENSPYRALFITGTRGYGKTALLEQMSLMAARNRWLCIDVHSAHASQIIMEQLAGCSQKTTERSFEPQALGVSLGRASSTSAISYQDYHLAQLLVEACRSLTLHRGIFITVDEIQKVPESDAENLCAAVQMALRKGLPVALVLAGLPGAKEKVSSYGGCTFMQRTPEIRLGSLLISETLDAFARMFSLVEGLEVPEDALWAVADFSKGHPFLMQLVGYYLVERANECHPLEAWRVTTADVQAVQHLAYASYRADVLEPTLAPLRNGAMAYLEAVVQTMQEDGRSRTGSVAKTLGKTTPELSACRQRLIDARILASDGRGYVRLNLPHLKRHLEEGQAQQPASKEDTWTF